MRFGLEFKYGTSRGRDTYGYRIVSLYVDGKKAASVNGGGYDMFGAVLGSWMTKQFQGELMAMADRAHARYFTPGPDGKRAPNEYREPRDGGLYGMAAIVSGSTGEVERISLDGACGDSSMRAILAEMGYSFRRVAGDVYDVASADQAEGGAA